MQSIHLFCRISVKGCFWTKIFCAFHFLCDRVPILFRNFNFFCVISLWYGFSICKSLLLRYTSSMLQITRAVNLWLYLTFYPDKSKPPSAFFPLRFSLLFWSKCNKKILKEHQFSCLTSRVFAILLPDVKNCILFWTSFHYKWRKVWALRLCI